MDKKNNIHIVYVYCTYRNRHREKDTDRDTYRKDTERYRKRQVSIMNFLGNSLLKEQNFKME